MGHTRAIRHTRARHMTYTRHRTYTRHGTYTCYTTYTRALYNIHAPYDIRVHICIDHTVVSPNVWSKGISRCKLRRLNVHAQNLSTKRDWASSRSELHFLRFIFIFLRKHSAKYFYFAPRFLTSVVKSIQNENQFRLRIIHVGLSSSYHTLVSDFSFLYSLNLHFALNTWEIYIWSIHFLRFDRFA